MADDPRRTTQGDTDTDSEWSCMQPDLDTDSLLRKIAQLHEEHSMLHNQMHVMAALAKQPVGQHVHQKAIVLQAAFRRHAMRKHYLCRRAAATKVQTAHRRHVQHAKWNVTLNTFPERTKAALLMRALDEKQRADKEKEKALELLASIKDVFLLRLPSDPYFGNYGNTYNVNVSLQVDQDKMIKKALIKYGYKDGKIS